MALSNYPQQYRHPKSNEPQWWYYENPRSIDVVIDAKKIGTQIIRIPARMLDKTTERQRLLKKKSK